MNESVAAVRETTVIVMNPVAVEEAAGLDEDVAFVERFVTIVDEAAVEPK